ncbi:MAG: PilZ domain-containing protein [Deltaproteobacteria bacterium]|nr:PilZ domain-containing protein [Deltaproteobacteria bacterium]MDQ3300085.1 PilZ domain-containing protein [Myxococcota bacterium]
MSEEQSRPGAERRQQERFELVVQVGLTHDRQSETLTVINISAGGVLLRNDRNVEFETGELIRIQFDVPELAPKFLIEAKVIRVVAPTTKAALLAAMWKSRDAEAGAALAQLLWTLSTRR